MWHKVAQKSQDQRIRRKFWTNEYVASVVLDHDEIKTEILKMKIMNDLDKEIGQVRTARTALKSCKLCNKLN